MCELYCDLHMHSVLSPCGDDLMTPNNIVNMAKLKELDVIAVTDHNCAGNLESIFKVANDVGMVVIPAMEVTVKEEAHILCYFKELSTCLEFSDYLYSKLMDVKNNEKIFGRQVILDSEDEEIGSVEKLLINAVDISFESLFKEVTKLDGAVVPAHVDKKSYSIIESLGFIPPNIAIKTIEVSKRSNKELLMEKKIYGDYTYITSSDAHMLEDIFEKSTTITPRSKTVKDVVEYLKNGR